MSVHAPCSAQHGRLSIEAYCPQSPHRGALRACLRQSLEVRRYRLDAAAERIGIHIVVSTAIDVAYHPRLRPSFELLDEAGARGLSDGGGVDPAFGRVANLEDTHRHQSSPPKNSAEDCNKTPSSVLIRTSCGAARTSRQFTAAPSSRTISPSRRIGACASISTRPSTRGAIAER